MCVCTVVQQSEPSFRRIALESSRSDRVWVILDDGITVGQVVDDVIVPRATFEIGDGLGIVFDIAADDDWLYAATGGLWRIPLDGDFEGYLQNDPTRVFQTGVPVRIWLDGNRLFWIRQVGSAGPYGLYVYDVDTDTETLLASPVAAEADLADLAVGPDGLVWVTVAVSPTFQSRIDRYTTEGVYVDSITPTFLDPMIDIVPFEGSIYVATDSGHLTRIETDGAQCVIEFPTWTTFDGESHHGPPNIAFTYRGLAANADRLAFSEGFGA